MRSGCSSLGTQLSVSLSLLFLPAAVSPMPNARVCVGHAGVRTTGGAGPLALMLERVGVQERCQTIGATAGARGFDAQDLVGGDRGRAVAGQARADRD